MWYDLLMESAFGDKVAIGRMADTAGSLDSV